MKRKALQYRKLLLKAHGVYITYRGKALDPEYVNVVFEDKGRKHKGDTTASLLDILAVVKNIVNTSLLQKLIEKWKSKN